MRSVRKYSQFDSDCIVLFPVWSIFVIYRLTIVLALPVLRFCALTMRLKPSVWTTSAKWRRSSPSLPQNRRSILNTKSARATWTALASTPTAVTCPAAVPPLQFIPITAENGVGTAVNEAFAEQYQIDYSECAAVLCPAVYCNDTEFSTTCNSAGMCEIVKKDDELPSICSDGSFPVNCFVDPCSVAPPCASNLDAKCRADYCGAIFYQLTRLFGFLKALKAAATTNMWTRMAKLLIAAQRLLRAPVRSKTIKII